MAYENELVMKGIKALLQAQLPGKLDEVETYWQGQGDPLTLPDPVAYHEGYKQTVLELPSTSFPFLSILVPNREPQREGAEWGYQEVAVIGGVHAFVIADDETTVSKMAHRYAQAIVLVFQSQQAIAGYSQLNYEPEVRVGVTMRHAKDGVAGDLFDPDKTDFIRIVEVLARLKGG
jgi:hypothetical protein